MPDMREAMNKAGISRGSGQVPCQQCGKPFMAREAHHKLCPDCSKTRSESRSGPSPSFPDAYPDYFGSTGELRPEYVTTTAEEIAIKLGKSYPKMTMSQLRTFYRHVKLQEGSLKNGRALQQVLVEINKLKPFARERAAKGKVPKYFADFIVHNVNKVHDEKTFVNGFAEHFQAVVAYCAGTIKER
jgi:CRISPR/Cas system CSM-associated protein Csm2 small subunit